MNLGNSRPWREETRRNFVILVVEKFRKELTKINPFGKF
jgi:hypothetical protein